METIVQVEAVGVGCALVRLNRPTALNALSSDLLRELSETIDRLQMSGCRVIILTGAGRAFCAGLDLKELRDAPGVMLGAARTHSVVDTLSRFRGIVIGAINGPAVTGGFELALCCDLVFASTTATFADTHVEHGLLPGWGLSQKLQRLVGVNRAKEISLLGARLDAQKAEALGIVNGIVAPDALIQHATAAAEKILKFGEASVAAYKRLIDEGAMVSLRQALNEERAASLKNFDP